MQAPGGPDEDTSGAFRFGGWTAPYFDDFLGKIMGEQMNGPFSLLLGRKTFDIFAEYWPEHEKDWPGINAATKYVVTSKPLKHEWNNSISIKGNLTKELAQIKEGDGPDLKVYGSSQLAKALFKSDLVDEIWLKIFPVILGTGKRLFDDGSLPAAFTLINFATSPSGVIVANYKRAGEVKTGSFE